MIWRKQKLFSLIAAILAGVGIIFFAWQSASFAPKGSSTEDEGGISESGNWRDALSVIPSDSLTRLLSANAGSASSTVNATTTTDILARELLTSYALAQRAKGATPLSDADAQALSGILAGKVLTDTTIKHYTEKDINVVSASTSSVAAYQKELSKVLEDFTRKNTVSELSVVAQAMERKDASKLAPLKGTASNLRILIASLLAMKTPETVVTLHLFLIQNYTTILSGVTDMQQIITDPALGLRGIAKYKQGMTMLDALGEMLKGVQVNR